MAELDLNGFNKGVPFDNKNNPLNPAVRSDHAAIYGVLSYNDSTQTIIGCINISNKDYHANFGLGPTPPFINTHMYVPEESADISKKIWLDTKTNEQLDDIIYDLKEKVIDIQVVVEGSYDFFSKLRERLNCNGNNFAIISILNNNSQAYKNKPWNVTGIIVNNSKFKVIDYNIIQQDYSEEHGTIIHKPRTLIVPYVRVMDLISKRCLIVLGVHIPGCISNFPRGGLEQLSAIIKQLRRKYTDDIVAIGDFNTCPNNIKQAMKEVNIAPVPYPTHINPNSEIAVYDNVVYVFNTKDAQSIEIAGTSALNDDSKAIVSSMINNFMAAKRLTSKYTTA